MAYKTFANGFPLPASDLNNYLMNQSVIVFADSTARTAALPTPTEGMITYLEDTNAYEGWTGAAWESIAPDSPITTEGDLIVGDSSGEASRLAIGTDDQVLTLASGTPIWADAAGGGGMELISSTALSGNSVTLSSIPSTFIDLQIRIFNMTHNASGSSVAQMKLRLNTDTGSNYYQIPYGILDNDDNIGSSWIGLSPNYQSTGDNLMEIKIPNYAGSSKKFVDYKGAFWDNINNRAEVGGQVGFWNNTAAITSITILDNFGNSFTGGTINLYGVK